MVFYKDTDKFVLNVTVPYSDELEEEFEANNGIITLHGEVEARRAYKFNGEAEVNKKLSHTCFYGGPIELVIDILILWSIKKGADVVAKALYQRLKDYTDTITINGNEMPLEEEEMEAYLGLFQSQV